MARRLLVGLIVNPIAGIGGPAGLKGSDDAWREALRDGVPPQAGVRASRFAELVGDVVDWLTAPGDMGVPGLPGLDGDAHLGETGPDDTRAAAEALRAAGVELICFVGGDGTATDVASAIGHDVPCLGVPAGVKITSAVFAHSIEEAAWVVSRLAPGFETNPRDVMDLDEAAYRDGRLETRLTGSLLVPLSPGVQGGKVATTVDTPLGPLVEQVLKDWDKTAVWLVGAGSVCHAVKKQFWGEPTLLGVDVLDGDRIAQRDLDALGVRAVVETAHAAGRPVRLLLSLIGGQGVLFGRGTQVIPPDVVAAIGWDAVTVAAPPEKLLGLRGLWIDTGDPDVDATAPTHMRVTAGWNETRMLKVNPPPA